MPNCVVCDAEFVKATNWQLYCSKSCHYKAYNQRNADRLSEPRKGAHKKYNESEKGLINRRKKARRKALLAKYKVLKGCELCGYNSHPAALHFDHRDPTEKSFCISVKPMTKLNSLFKEIRKCRVLCANCHMIETQKQRSEGVIFPRQKYKI